MSTKQSLEDMSRQELIELVKSRDRKFQELFEMGVTWKMVRSLKGFPDMLRVLPLQQEVEPGVWVQTNPLALTAYRIEGITISAELLLNEMFDDEYMEKVAPLLVELDERLEALCNKWVVARSEKWGPREEPELEQGLTPKELKEKFGEYMANQEDKDG